MNHAGPAILVLVARTLLGLLAGFATLTLVLGGCRIATASPGSLGARIANEQIVLSMLALAAAITALVALA